MIAFREGFPFGAVCDSADYCIQLRITPENREDAWDVCGVVERFGGVEVAEGCFAFSTEQRWLMAVEAGAAEFWPHRLRGHGAAQRQEVTVHGGPACAASAYPSPFGH